MTLTELENGMQEVTFDVAGGLTQTGWLFEPSGPPRALLVCLAGGTYDKHYWHLEVPGREGYSFAEFFRDRGFAVVALDHLGVGGSSDRPDGAGLADLAAGDAEVVSQLRARYDAPTVGVGHSMGACLTTMIQAENRLFDAVALLGYGVNISNVPGAVVGPEAVAANYEVLRQITGSEPGATSWVVPRGRLRDLFYASDVPDDVVAADSSHVSRLPAQANAEVITAGFVDRYAADVDVPVFLGFGGHLDVSPDPHAEPTHYRHSPDVTLHLVEGSGHCHNFAERREALWQRISDWLPAASH